MAKISQKQLFVWPYVKKLSDVGRLQLVLSNLPDEPLMELLEYKRKKTGGNNKYPIRPVWNSIIAGIIYGHETIESLRRELKRNPFLREICGFNLLKGIEAVPSSGAYSRFTRKLIEHKDSIRKMFDELLRICYQQLPGFGENLAIDGKAINSYAKRAGKKQDTRGEHDAKWAKHVIRNELKNGTFTETVKKWFGFTLHLISDTKYELPIEYTVLPASDHEIPVAHALLKKMARDTPERLEQCKYLCGDRGYDDGKLHKKLWDEYGIKPIIDIRRSWKDGEETRAYEKAPGVVYNNKGEVFCISPYFNEQKRMACRGFEKGRNCLKYCCPAVHYGIECKGERFCELKKQIRIPISIDRRIFSPVARDSYKWKSLYNGRSAVERVNSRIDNMFGFERHTIRGLKKMNFRMHLAFVLMLAFAVGKIRENKEHEIRQFLRAG